MPHLKCRICKSEFYARPSHIKVGQGKYCSNGCHYKDVRMKNRKKRKCFICSKEIYKTKTQLKNSKSRKYFCSKSCQTIWRNNFYSGKKHKGWKDGKSTYRNVLNKQDVPKVCSRCGLDDRRVLAVHHIDHDKTNYKVANLAWLCHNCHRLIHIDKNEEDKYMAILV